MDNGKNETGIFVNLNKDNNRLQTSHAQSHRGAIRKINEDAFLELANYGVWVVADGMGGHSAGDVASQLVIDTIQQVVETTNIEDLTCDILVNALKSANEELLQLSNKQLEGKIAGSTVVILFIKDGRYYMLWAGDSRGYLLRNRELTQVTKDHSQVNDMVDEGVISAEDAEHHPLANVITRAVGVDKVLDVEINEDTIKHGDIFLLCSDGLNKEVNDDEIERSLQSGSIIDSGMALMHASLVRNARDNVTCVLVKHREQFVDASVIDNDITIPFFRPIN